MRLKWYFFLVITVFLIEVVSTEDIISNNEKVEVEPVPFPTLVVIPNETDGIINNKPLEVLLNSMDETKPRDSIQEKEIHIQKPVLNNKSNEASISGDSVKPVVQTHSNILESHQFVSQNQISYPHTGHNNVAHAGGFIDSSEEHNDDDDDDDDTEDLSYSQSGSFESSEENNSNDNDHHLNFKPNYNHQQNLRPYGSYESNENYQHKPQSQYQQHNYPQQYPAQHTFPQNIKPQYQQEHYISTQYYPSQNPVNHHYTEHYVVKPQSHDSKPYPHSIHINDKYSGHSQEHHLQQNSHELNPSVLNIENNEEYNEALVNSPNQNVHIHIGPNHPHNHHHSVNPTTTIKPTPVIVTETATVTSTIYPPGHHHHSSEQDTTNIQLTNVHVNLPPQIHGHHHSYTNGTTANPTDTTHTHPTHSYHHTKPYYTGHTTMRPYYPDHTTNKPYYKPHYPDYTTHRPTYYTEKYTHKYTTLPTYYRPHTTSRPTHFIEHHHHHMDHKPQIWCGAYEQYNPCGSECQPTCKNQGKRSCDNKCVSGCFCLQGYARHNGQCIPFKSCPRRKCKKTEVFKECGTTCPLSCDNLHHFRNIKCPSICVPGCFCKDGYVRDHRGKCILQHKCNRNTIVSKPNKNKYSINNNKFEHDNSHNNKYQSSYEHNNYHHDQPQYGYENNNHGGNYYGNHNNNNDNHKNDNKKNKHKSH